MEGGVPPLKPGVSEIELVQPLAAR
jgi:hypothetical protein